MLGVALPRPCAGGKVREGQSKSAAATAAAVHTAANAVNTATRPRRSAQRDSPHSANMTLQIASQANSFCPNTSQAKSRKNSAKITLTLSQSKSAGSANSAATRQASRAAVSLTLIKIPPSHAPVRAHLPSRSPRACCSGRSGCSGVAMVQVVGRRLSYGSGRSRGFRHLRPPPRTTSRHPPAISLARRATSRQRIGLCDHSPTNGKS